ncbi:hypothetical protein F4553_000244 [Allocatelliglobosispora scoriae]|uniref:Uncharacterized protein n=1 Tax=Allocatelliglobosispora scoriae TaxID=643052 RepID=A0A841BGV4_9ACTN|nr:hypothetical protein [Allocatelliglobosispora scoriae]MBB5866865.1 hypothetical protein [Allocatelliglobosispora scoriae]
MIDFWRLDVLVHTGPVNPKNAGRYWTVVVGVPLIAAVIAAWVTALLLGNNAREQLDQVTSVYGMVVAVVLAVITAIGGSPAPPQQDPSDTDGRARWPLAVTTVIAVVAGSVGMTWLDRVSAGEKATMVAPPSPTASASAETSSPTAPGTGAPSSPLPASPVATPSARPAGVTTPCADVKPQSGDPQRLHSCTRLTIRHGDAIDLDTSGPQFGKPSSRSTAGPVLYDIYLNNASEGSYLEDDTGKGIAKIGGLPSYRACRSSAAYDDEVRPVEVGDLICIKTELGRYAMAFVIEAPRGSNPVLVADFIVWKGAAG